MYRVCIALVDATRARFFTWDRTSDELGAHERLIERGELVNPTPGRLIESAPAVSDATHGSPSAHRPDQRWQISRTAETEFARIALAALRELLDDYAPQRLILCASPRMLVKLRTCSPGLLPDGMICDELPRDLLTVSPSELRGTLALHRLLPARPCEAAIEYTERANPQPI